MPEQILKDFAAQGGRFVLAASDLGFIGQVRGLLSGLGIAPTAVQVRSDAQDLPGALAEVGGDEGRTVVLVERFLEGKETSYAFKRLRAQYPEVGLVLVIESVPEPERVMLYKELGVDAFVRKPVATDALAAKIAQVIQPSSRLLRLLRMGRRLLVAGRADQALELAERALAVAPETPVLLVLKGDALERQGRMDEARRAWEEAHFLSRDALDPLCRLARAVAGESVPDDFGRDDARGDEDPEARRAWMRYLRRLDRLSPLNPDRKVALGDVHLQLGQEGVARDFFDQAQDLAAVELPDWLADVCASIGDVWAARDWGRSEEYYRRALSVRGQRQGARDVDVYNRLGLSLRKQGQWERAVQAYRKGLRLDERNERLLYNMAMAYADGRDYGKSRDLLLRAFEATPNFTGGDDPRACYNIAMVFTRMRDRDTALRYAERSLALDPTFESARVLRERLHAKTTAAPDASDLPPDLPEG